MTTERTKSDNLPVITDDGFDKTEVDSSRIIQGTILRCVDGQWSDADGMPIAAETTLLALGTTQCLQRWENQLPAETIPKERNEPLPDVDDLNAKIPKEKWEIGLDGEPRPPWSLQHIVYLLDPRDASLFTYINSTTGASIAVERLRSKVGWMRQLRGTNVVPLIKLETRPMKTRFGKKQRPEFTILEWRQLARVGAKEAPAQISYQPANQPQTDNLASLQPVSEPTLKEEIRDEIPYLG